MTQKTNHSIPFRLLWLVLTAMHWLMGADSGRVAGTVLDSETGRPLAGVLVAIEGHADVRNATGADGKFVLTAAPGEYTLRFSVATHAPVALEGVVVQAGETVDASTMLAAKTVVTTVDVVEKISAAQATAEAALNERRLAAAVSDSLSREELSSGVAGDAAGALEKVTGVSVVGDGFVYVRGLGERYSATQLNGAAVPTTEPDKRVVPLDLFPSGMIESIGIVKSYTPDLPGEFAGGLVQLKTVEFPAQRMFQFSAKSGFNSRTTFQRFGTYPGGRDFLGFGAGSRGIPAAIPSNARLFPGAFTPAQLQQMGRSFENNWQPDLSGNGRLAADWSMSGGGTFGRWGLVGALSFSNRPQRQRELQRYIRQGAGRPVIFTEYPDYTEYGETARLGGVLNAALRLHQNHKIVFRNTVTHEGDKTARQFSGYDGGLDSEISSERLRYVERSLLSSGVEGEHVMSGARNSVVHWQFTYSKSRRAEPDLRE